MRLLTFLKRTPSARAARPAAAQSGSGDESIERVRTRARHRLIGAVVLLGVAVIGFPLLFETEPRPIPVDLPIHIPQKDDVPPLALSGQGAGKLAAQAEEIIIESAEEAGRDVDVAEPVSPVAAAPRGSVRSTAEAKPAPEPLAPAALTAQKATKPDPAAEDKVAARTEAKPVAKAEPKPEPEPKRVVRDEPRQGDAGRALALLEGRASPLPRAEAVPVADKGRFVLQVGAFSESSGAREARQKAERIGLQTYLQEVETSEGRRIRVRVGPFSSREAAEQAAARLRTAGLPAALLPQ